MMMPEVSLKGAAIIKNHNLTPASRPALFEKKI